LDIIWLVDDIKPYVAPPFWGIGEPHKVHIHPERENHMSCHMLAKCRTVSGELSLIPKIIDHDPLLSLPEYL
jgi:hypothetical protein